MEIIEFAKAYKNLGWSVQAQLGMILDGYTEDCNPEAIRVMVDSLSGFESSNIEEIAEIVEIVLEAAKDCLVAYA